MQVIASWLAARVLLRCY